MGYTRSVVGLKVDDHQFTTSLSVAELLDVAIPGRSFLPRAKNDPLTARVVKDLKAYHDKIQRDLAGRKLSNAKGPLKDYLVKEWIGPNPTGVLPPFLLWFAERLETTPLAGDDRFQEIHLGAGNRGILLDAESRIEAMLYVLDDEGLDKTLGDKMLERRVSVSIFHGLEADTAAKFFADINGKGVGVNANLLVARDFSDPWSVAAIEVFADLGVPLELDKRQVSQRSEAIITALQARSMIAAMYWGVGAVSYGGKRIPTEKEGSEIDFDAITSAARRWLDAVFTKFDPQVFKDRNKVLRSVPCIVSIGAVGQEHVAKNANRRLAEAFLGDEEIDWETGPHWAGVAGKLNSAGRFSVGSGKENAYATFRALTDEADPGYARVRHRATPATRESQGTD